MFKDFLTALIHKIVVFLKENPEFFEKRKNLEDLSIPKAFKDYLENVKEKDFLHDLARVTLYIEDCKNTDIKNNEFLKSLREFLTTELARKLDHLDGKFYLSKTTEKREVIEQLIKGDSLLATSLRNILVQFNYQQIAEEIYNLSAKIEKTSYTVVQSPREIDPELKKEIRQKIQEKSANVFPVFQINRRLIGGIRIFQDGETIDNSWLSRVLFFTSLTAK